MLSGENLIVCLSVRECVQHRQWKGLHGSISEPPVVCVCVSE